MEQNSLPELTFPTEYPVKVIGLDEDDFADFVVELISRHVPGLSSKAFSFRPSSTGKYLSISVTFMAESRSQVDALYLELGEHKRVLVAL